MVVKQCNGRPKGDDYSSVYGEADDCIERRVVLEGRKWLIKEDERVGRDANCDCRAMFLFPTARTEAILVLQLDDWTRLVADMT